MSLDHIYLFLAGPMVWVALAVFVAGVLIRLALYVSLAKKKEPFVFTYFKLRHGLASAVRWVVPFSTTAQRQHPVMTSVAFVFHLALLSTPFLVPAHLIMIEESLGVSGWSPGDNAADGLTMAVLLCCLFFLIRRLASSRVRYVTRPSDFLLLALVAAPFATGFVAYHQLGYYRLFMVLHLLSGELLLMVLPFSRLSHMIFGFFTRAYAASEFRGVRRARDW